VTRPELAIASVEVYGYDLTYVHGEYVMSGGRVVTRLPSTVVRVVTEAGVEGFGEACPLGPAYLPGHAAGARAALAELAPAVLGLDAVNLAAVGRAMDAALAGHGYAKSALDMACWDVLGRAAGLPVCDLLGGRRQDSFPLYVAVPLGPVAETVEHVRRLKAEGVRRFQLKLGADPAEDAERVRAVVEATDDADVVIADANGGWRLQDAVAAARLLDGLPRVHLEQPCPTLDECIQVRRRTSLPMVLDESITDAQSLLRAWSAQAMEGVNLKIGKVGGLSRARVIRDLAEALGLGLTIEDTWGGDVATAAISHLAASTSEAALFTVSFMNDWVEEHVAGYEPRSQGGYGGAPGGPGLGVEVDIGLLGDPLLSRTSPGRPRTR
jgi:L-alanine-DL-glutamate epimerase-like enolase superfamily enzyme